VTASAIRDATPCRRRAELGAGTANIARRRGIGLLRRHLGEGEHPSILSTLRGETLTLTLEREGNAPGFVLGETVDLVSVSGGEQVTVLQRAEARTAEVDTLYASILAEAVRRRFGRATSIRIGLVGESESDGVRWLTGEELPWNAPAMRSAAEDVVRMHREPLAPRVPLGVCEATRCPHVVRCYPLQERGAVAPAVPQTSFGFFTTDEERTRRRPGKTRS
jgi:hypothetical protein